MTSRSPSVVAISELLRQQLNFTRQFVALQTRLHSNVVTCLQSAAESYRYTTLANTQQVRLWSPQFTTVDRQLLAAVISTVVQTVTCCYVLVLPFAVSFHRASILLCLHILLTHC